MYLDDICQCLGRPFFTKLNDSICGSDSQFILAIFFPTCKSLFGVFNGNCLVLINALREDSNLF